MNNEQHDAEASVRKRGGGGGAAVAEK